MVIKIAHAVKDEAFDNEVLIDTLKVLIKLYTEKYVIKDDMSDSEKNKIIENKAGALKRINELTKEARIRSLIIPKDLSDKIRQIKLENKNK